MAFEDELDQTVERIIDEAIDFYMYGLGWIRHGGNYLNSMLQGWEITPPGNPSRRSGGQCLFEGQPQSYAFEYGEGTNVGSHVYAHFEESVREVFDRWRAVPDPKDFESNLDDLRNAAWFISVTVEGGEIGNIELEKLKTLQSRIGNDDMGGTMILTFEQNFVTPLPAVIHGQYAAPSLRAGRHRPRRDARTRTRRRRPSPAGPRPRTRRPAPAPRLGPGQAGTARRTDHSR